jgi:hypothetical protein
VSGDHAQQSTIKSEDKGSLRFAEPDRILSQGFKYRLNLEVAIG